MARDLKVTTMQDTEMAYKNLALVSAADFKEKEKEIRHVEVLTPGTAYFLFSIAKHPGIAAGEIAFSKPQRNWTGMTLDTTVSVSPHYFTASDRIVTGITLLIDFQTRKQAVGAEPLDSDEMAKEFSMEFSNTVFTRGQELAFRYQQKGKFYTLKVLVKSLEGSTLNSDVAEIMWGPLNANAAIVFDRAEGSEVILVGRSKGKSIQRALINPDWDFQSMGIGGLDKEFSDIFRRAFASRVFPVEFVEQLAMRHVRGILLFGPPGTGKTLIARKIGKMLNAREVRIVNGPEILNKYVGESEANMRNLFAPAEEEWKRCGRDSGLYMIIFDEIDAICKQRGSMAGSTGVHDTVVNQLLSKLDGVEQLNNILVIGMTNRKDMIDEALLRPGRMEVQLEISLPDEHGRHQILTIHTALMREHKKMDPGVDVTDLAKRTKNFSGAEIEGLVRAAQSSAMNRLVKAGGKVQVSQDDAEKLMVTSEDFDYALEHDIKPAFGHNEEELQRLLAGGLIVWSDNIKKILEKGDLLTKEAASPDTRGFVRVLLAGSRNSGKTFLAAEIARRSDFPFIKVCSPEDMVGYSESAKCMQLRKVFDNAYRSSLSVIIIDNVERLLDYSPIGQRYSNLVLQALLILLGKRPPPNRRLLVLATTSNENFLREVDLLSSFSTVINVPKLTTANDIVAVAENAMKLNSDEIGQVRRMLERDAFKFAIGIKRLLELCDYAKQSEGNRVNLLLDSLQGAALGID